MKPHDIREAVTAAVNEAIELNLLGGYFKKCKEDAIMDCLTEFDEKLYEKMRYEEGLEDGRAEQLAADQAQLAQRDTQLAADQARIAELEARIAQLEAAAN